MSSSENCEIFTNSFFYRTPPVSYVDLLLIKNNVGWFLLKEFVGLVRVHYYSQLSLIWIHIIRTFTNSNEIPRSPQNFLTNSHGKTCIIRASIIRTFTNPNTFCWSSQRKAPYNSNFLGIGKHITRILVIVYWFFIIHVLLYSHIFLSRYDNFTRDL